MAHSGLCCGLYRGRFFMKDLSNPNSALLPVGNAEAVINQELTEINQPNFQSLGGNACSVAFVNSLGLDLTLHCTSPENLAIAFMGESYQKTPANVPAEVHTVRAIEELIPFENVPSKATPIVVSPEGGGSPFVLNTDYIVTSSGIQIIEGSNIPLNSQISVSYSYGANYVVNAQTVAQKTFLVVLDGVNVGEDGEKPVVLKAWRVKFAPTDTFNLISGEEFALINLAGEILRDDSKAVDSKFFKAEFGIEGSGSY